MARSGGGLRTLDAAACFSGWLARILALFFSFFKKENNVSVIGRRQGLLPSAWSSSGGVARQVSTRGRAGFAQWQSRQ